MNEPLPVSVPQHLWHDIESPAAGDGPPAVSVGVLNADAETVPEGDVIVLLPPDVVPREGFERAHARWHVAVTDAVSLGPVEPDDPGAVEPLGLVRDMTRDLTDLADGCHLAAADCTFAVRRELFEYAGSLGSAAPELRRLDLLYRLHAAGAVFVAEPEARARGPVGSLARDLARAASAGKTLELDDPGAAALVPLPPFRSTGSPRRHERPALAVNVEIAADTPAEEAMACVEAVLASRCGDFDLRIQVPADHPAGPAIAGVAERDQRASLGPSSLEGRCDAAFQVTLPPLAALDPRTLGDLHELGVGEEVGALHVTVPGASPQEGMIEAVATAALRRAKRVIGATGEPVDEVIGRLFGERWVSGVEVSTRRHGVAEPQVTEHGPLAAATDPKHERNAHLRFRDRAEDLAAKSANMAQRTLAERLRARDERQAAERFESRLSER